MSATTSAPLGRGFWTIFASASVSGIGDGLRYVALPLLAVSITRDARLVSLVGTATFLPVVLFGLLSGAVADRVERRRLLWRTDVVRTVVATLLAGLVLAGSLSIWALLGLTFAMGVLGTFFDNTANAMTPQLVEKDDLPWANGLLLSGQTITAQFLGPAVGGVLFAVSTALPFWIDAVTFAGSAALLLILGGSYRAQETPSQTHLGGEILEGLRWLWRHRLLRTLALLLAVLNGVAGAAEAVLVLYVLEVLHEPRLAFSALLVSLAVGGLAGALIAPRLRGRSGPVGVAVTSALVVAGALAVLGVSSSLAASVAACVVFGVAGSAWNVFTISLRQSVVPAALLGRVTSSYRLIGLGAIPLGAALGGLVAHHYGLHTPYWLGAALLLVATLACWRPLRAAAREAV